MPAGNHDRTPWTPQPDFASHAYLTQEPGDGYEQDVSDIFHMGLPNHTVYDLGTQWGLARDLATQLAGKEGDLPTRLHAHTIEQQDQEHERLLEEARRQQEQGIRTGKVVVFRTVVEAGAMELAHSSQIVPRRRSVGN